MKLELKHLAPYLPYSVAVMRNKRTYILTTDILARSEKNNTISNIKPIFRPLSDLIKEVVVCGYNNNKPFIPILQFLNNGNLGYRNINGDNPYFIKATGDKPNQKYPTDRFYISINTRDPLGENNYKKIAKLAEWHFDIFGLIKEGLAIDINEVTNE